MNTATPSTHGARPHRICAGSGPYSDGDLRVAALVGGNDALITLLLGIGYELH